MTPPRIFVLVLQYNNSQETIKCLESLKGLKYPDFSVVVIDNDSEISEKDNINNFINDQNDLNRWFFISNDKNLGYAGGNNVGIKYAIENHADYILILNNDTEAKPDLLEKLASFAENNNVPIVGSAIQVGDKIEYQGKFFWLREPKHSITKSNSNILKKNEYLTGAAVLIKREVFEKIGLIDEKYFLYYEEADFFEKAKRHGFVLGIWPEALVSHSLSATTSKLGAPLLFYYHYRNACLFNMRWAPWPYKVLLPFTSLWIILKQLVKIAIMSDKREISKAILRGIFDFYRGKFGKFK